MHAHNVYFSLKDKSEENIAALIADSKKYLAPIAGIESFVCGVPEPEADRPVNDRDFDVALHVLFTSKELHDAYQVDSRHNEYVERNKDNWEAVRVFDTAIR